MPMFDAEHQVAIVGVGHSAIGRRLDRPAGPLALDAVIAALDDAGLTPADVDGAATHPLFTGGNEGSERGDGRTTVSVRWMVNALNLGGLRWWSDCQGGNVSTVIEQAAMAIAHGRCDHAIVWRSMSMPKTGSYQRTQSSDTVRGDAVYSRPYGLSGPIMSFALAYMRYLRSYGARREDTAAIAVAFRNGANRNPVAHFRDEPLTVDDYLAARMISDPMCLFDCDIPVDGAGAIVLARADRARDLRHPPAYVRGLGQSGFLTPTPFASIGTMGPYLYDEMRHTTETIGRGIWRTSGMRPADVDAAMLYDGFAPDVYFWLEGLGFCGEGEAHQFVQDGRIEIDGAFPVNTFGGSLSEGRLHGIGHWIEATRQVQGRAGERQVAKADNVLVATGMLANGSGAILSRTTV
jgi:acetyl-CoA acetyltransferase